MMTKREKGFSIIMVNILVVILLLLPVPAAGGWPWPDTGQTKCYDNDVEIPCPSPGQPFYGQDAQYQGPTRSYNGPRNLDSVLSYTWEQN